jgi:MinD-like ATPase involved in chromosome partitioning or flagellar assembly
VPAIILCDSDGEFLSSLDTVLARQLPDAERAQVRTAADAIDLAARRDTAVVVLGPSVPVDLALAAGERMAGSRPQTLVVMVTQRLTTELLRRALRAGLKDVVASETTTYGEVSAAVEDAGVMLHLEPRHTIYDAAQASDRLDAEMLRGFLTKHSSGLSVLLAPRSPEQAESITTARLNTIIALLQGMFDYVIIDTAGSFAETVLTAIDTSDDVLAIATMEMPSVKNTMVSLQRLRQLGYGDDRVKLVLNRADSKVVLKPGDVERRIGGRIVAQVPSDRLVPRSVNKGVPVVMEAPRSGVAKSLTGVADLVAKEATD